MKNLFLGLLVSFLFTAPVCAGDIGHGDGEPDHQDDPGTAVIEWLVGLFPSDSE